jgi:drug/metabolite transporter (DMT)-like permease
MAQTQENANIIRGALFGLGAACCWAFGFVAARHGITIGFHPADLALHRFLWAGLLLLPFALRDGVTDLGGIGWPKGLTIFIFAGPPQALLPYVGFTLVPLGHGALIQPSSATLFGLLFATLVLHEAVSPRRVIGALAIVAGLLLLGAEALTTFGTGGIAGDLCFAFAGLLWAMFGTAIRMWRISAVQAATVISALAILIYVPIHAVVFGFSGLIAMGFWNNLLQVLCQGVFAGALAILLFTQAVVLLGAGRAGTFPALVPALTLATGFLALGEVPTAVQLAGLAVVAFGFRFILKP